MKKRIISILLAVLLVLPLSLITVSADGTNAFKLSISGSTVDYVGNTYSYIINVSDIDGSNGGLNFVQFTLVYPKQYLEYVKGSASFTGASGWTYSYTDDPTDRIVFTATGTGSTSALVTGDIQFTVTFSAKSTGSGQLEFTALEGTQLTQTSIKVLGTSTPLSVQVQKQAVAKPGIPELANKTADMVVLKSYTGYEYSRDGISWSDSNSFTGLSSNTTYVFYQRVKETDTTAASPTSDGLSVTTNKKTGATVSTPVVQSKTATTITIQPVTGCEYSKDNGNSWQDSNVFTGLSPNTTYFVVQRMKETTDTEAGENSTSLMVTTEKVEATSVPGAPLLHSRTPNTIILTLVTGCEYSKDGGATWQDSNIFTGLSSNASYTFYQRYKETNTQKASEKSAPATFTTLKNEGPSAPSAPVKQSSTPTQITLVATPGYEYSIDDGASWQTSNTFTNLSPNTQYYFVQRVAETLDTQPSAKSQKTGIATIKYSNTATPVAPVLSTRTDTTISLQNLNGYEYTINNGLTWQTNSVFTGLLPFTEYTVKQRIAETDDTEASVMSSELVVKTLKTPTATPAAPEIESKTDTTIKVVVVTGCEYSRDNVTYNDNGLFEGLSPNTKYVIYQRVKETATTQASNPSYVECTTDKSTCAVTPSAPELQSKTATSITLKQIVGYEYSMDSGASWQTSNVFTNLQPNTEYSFVQRVAETDSTKASEKSSTLAVKTGKNSGSGDVLEPIAILIGPSEIHLKLVDGYEYRIGDGDTWQDSPNFIGLLPNTTYNFTQRIKETTNTYASSISGVLSVKTDKYTVSIDDVVAPVLSSKTATSITLVSVTGYLYSINDGATWQDSPVFTGLSPNTTYTFVQKVAETDTTYESAMSQSLSVITNKNSQTEVPENPELVERTDVSLKFKQETGVEYSINGGTSWQTSSTFTNLTANTNYTVISRYAENNTTYVGNANTGTSAKTMNPAPNAPSAPIVNVTNNKATITPTTGYEYSKDGSTWQTSNEFTNLTPNTQYTFYQRVAGDNDTSPSQPSQGTTVTTNKNPAPNAPSAPTLASKTGTSITINSIQGYEYSINNGVSWQSSNVFTGLTPVTQYSIIQRVKETDTTLASPSSQPLNVTTGKANNTIVPEAPEIESTTTTTITVVAISNYEYSLNKTVWQSSNVFTGLVSGKQYTIYQRIAETETMSASASSLGTIASTVSIIRPATPDAPTLLDLTATSVYLLFIPGYEYSLGGSTWQRSIAFENLLPETTYTFYQRVAATGTSVESLISDPLIVKTLKYTPDTPTEVKAPIVSNIEPTAIYLIGFGGYEYSCDGGKTYQSKNTFVGLKPNTEYTIVQRIAATSTATASKPSEAVVVMTLKADQGKPSKPVIESVDGTTVTIKKVDNVEYSNDNGVNWQSSNVFTDLQVNVIYTFVVRYKADDTHYASEASDPLQYIIESQHKHIDTKEERKEPTCEEDGYSKIVCVECGEVIKEVVLPAVGHSYEWKTVKNATCQEEGEEQLVCDKCGKVNDSRVLPKTEHKLGNWEKVDDKTEGRKCSDCGKVIEVRLINNGTSTTETTTDSGKTPQGKVTPGLLIFIIVLIVILLLIIAFVIWYIIKEKQKKKQVEQ